jgi:hypothetical protein
MPRILHANGRKIMMRGGSVLLSRGGSGAGSSYESPEEYKDITGRGLGLGLFAGHGLSALKSMQPKSISKKVSNIRF